MDLFYFTFYFPTTTVYPAATVAYSGVTELWGWIFMMMEQAL